jgi:hypothetical protein
VLISYLIPSITSLTRIADFTHITLPLSHKKPSIKAFKGALNIKILIKAAINSIARHISKVKGKYKHNKVKEAILLIRRRRRRRRSDICDDICDDICSDCSKVCGKV